MQQARAWGITGWVRNRTDGSVEALLQGTPKRLAQMCEWMMGDAHAAIPETMTVTELLPPFPRFDDFEQRATE